MRHQDYSQVLLEYSVILNSVICCYNVIGKLIICGAITTGPVSGSLVLTLACFALVEAVEGMDVVVEVRIRAAFVEPDAVMVTVSVGTAGTAAVAVTIAALWSQLCISLWFESRRH